MWWWFWTGFFSFARQKKWLLVALDWWSSYTVVIVWEFAWGDVVLVVLDKWSSYKGGRLNRFDCNILWAEQIYKPFSYKPFHNVFIIKKRRSADAQYWTVTLSNWKKQPPKVFYKTAVLKNCVIFTGKHQCENFKSNYFEEHLCTAASELTLWSDCLELCFWIAFKSDITKTPVSFKSEL